MADKQNGKWPIPAFPKPQTYPNKSPSSGRGAQYASKHSANGSMNVAKAAQVKAKQ